MPTKFYDDGSGKSVPTIQMAISRYAFAARLVAWLELILTAARGISTYRLVNVYTSVLNELRGLKDNSASYYYVKASMASDSLFNTNGAISQRSETIVGVIVLAILVDILVPIIASICLFIATSQRDDNQTYQRRRSLSIFWLACKALFVLGLLASRIIYGFELYGIIFIIQFALHLVLFIFVLQYVKELGKIISWDRITDEPRF